MVRRLRWSSEVVAREYRGGVCCMRGLCLFAPPRDSLAHSVSLIVSLLLGLVSLLLGLLSLFLGFSVAILGGLCCYCLGLVSLFFGFSVAILGV